MKVCVAVFIFLSVLSFGQTKDNYGLDKPIDIPLMISGTFGELRSNHFHSGVDFSSNYKIGDPVFAPADGVINRIKVSAFGYGKALYLRHANGYTTVYGHLDEYAPKIQNYVTDKHYALEKFEIELFPLAVELPIKKGEIIGYIGNTGGSGGPHLHYEIRNTQTENIINPLITNLRDKITDSEHPIINSLFVYPLNDSTIIDDTHTFFEVALNKQNNNYRSKPIFTNGTIGFGINTHDTQNGSRGKNGVYSITTFLNGSKHFEVVFDEFSFDESKFINQYIDYKYYQLSGNRVQKLFVINELPLSLIKHKKNDGKIVVNKNEDYIYKIEVSDVHQNKQIIEIPIKYQEFPVKESIKPKGNYIDYLKDYIFEEENVTVEWDARTFFEDVYLDVKIEENKIWFHKDEYPVQKNINIKIIVPDGYDNLDKTFIGKTDGKRIKYFDTWKRGNDFRIRTKELGVYELVKDLDEPVIKFLNKKTEFTLEDVLTFEIVDDLSGIGTFNGYLNNQWVLFEYDYKTKKLIHKLNDNRFQPGKNQLKLEVYDKVGNVAIFESTIEVNN